MAVSKWDLFKQIEKLPDEKYPQIKEYLDKLMESTSEEIIIDNTTKEKMQKSLDEYARGEYLSFNQVFEKGDSDVQN